MKRRLASLAAAAILWLGAVSAWIAGGPEVTGKESGETAIVLGAAVAGDVPSPVFAARLDHAGALFGTGRVKRILTTGGRSPEDAVSEAEAGAAYLQASGIPAAAIFREEKSRTTRQNLDNAATVLGELRGQPVLIVSDPLHMRRAMGMAAAAGLNAQPSPTPLSRYKSLATRLPFLAREVWFIHLHWLLGI